MTPKHTKLVVSTVLAALLGAGFQLQANEPASTPVKVNAVESTTAKSVVPEGAVWIDVRSAEEFAAGHLSGAVNIVHSDIATGIDALKLDKATPIALYCKSGRRAGIALDTLQQLGYTNVSNQGGYEQLKQEHATEHERQ